ncbi:MAG: hypothetical protein LAO77_22720 [Acidobacteriia bacterium]|nr:hypothetical protein [Terriglobia bacterium]
MKVPFTSLNVEAHRRETYPEPSAESGGVSFKPATLAVPFVVTATVMGTPSVTAAVSMQPLQNVTFVFPGRATSSETLERYEKRRKEMIASGIPLLSDEEIRAEIRDRKGVDESQS